MCATVPRPNATHPSDSFVDSAHGRALIGLQKTSGYMLGYKWMRLKTDQKRNKGLAQIAKPLFSFLVVVSRTGLEPMTR
jgi:hypothetical protein